MKENHGVVG